MARSGLFSFTANFWPRHSMAAELRSSPLRPSFGAGVNDDARLIDDALAGATAAFDELVLKYQDRLFNTIAHVVGSPHEAGDVVQEAFVQAYIKLSTFQRTAAFYTWLYRIAFNIAVSRQRRHRPIASVEQNRELTGEEPLGHGDSPSRRMEQQERVAQVQAALGRLSDEHRMVLVLREMDGCAYEAIAEVLDVPVGTVRSRLHRARLELREQLKQVLQEDLK
jgi:RNA polymerase sigma-70 factor, ECF subfamily